MLRRLLAVLVAAPLLAVSASAQTATTVCKDGTTSATTGRGACTGHGGVDKSASKKAAAAVKAERKAASKAPAAAATSAAAAPAAAAKQTAATVTCSDGSSSKAGRGACARHGGVKLATAATVPMRPAPSATPARPAPASTAPSSATVPTRPAPARPATPAPSTAHASNTDPTGATAQCKDGTYSHSASHRGACSRHQGVARWL